MTIKQTFRKSRRWIILIKESSTENTGSKGVFLKDDPALIIRTKICRLWIGNNLFHLMMGPPQISMLLKTCLMKLCMRLGATNRFNNSMKKKTKNSMLITKGFLINKRQRLLILLHNL